MYPYKKLSLLVMGTDVYPMASQSTSGQAFDECRKEKEQEEKAVNQL